jgi:CSLREA domain-containing protein
MNIRPGFIFFISVAMAFSLVVITPAQPVHASTLIVNTLTDEFDFSCVDGDCSLRDAIFAAGVSGDVITFSVTGIIPLTLGELTIGKDITITGPGADLLTISGEDTFRVFFINNPTSIVTITGVTIANGKVTDDDGGGIRNHGTLTLDQVTIDNNTAAVGTSLIVDGGGVHNTNTLTITNSLLINNEANFTGGAISHVGTSLNISNVTINDNYVAGLGGGGIGGGIASINSGTLTMDAVSITSNIAKTAGGLYINNMNQFEMTNSLVYSNEATDNIGGVGVSGVVGIYTIRNSTISKNRQTTSSIGQAGGLEVNGPITANLDHVTITNNLVVGTGGGAGIFASGSPTVNIQNSIVALNTASNSSDDDCNGTINSLDYNLIQDADGNCIITGTTTNNITNQDPLLNPLADNGGATRTHSLQAGSPALNVIPNSVNGCGTTFTTDQRGESRPQGSNCDIGAFEDTLKFTLALKSENTNDGWILESAETSGNGGTLNSTATNFNLGDDAANKQYRAILHFDTSSLPDNAVIISATLQIKKQGVVGSNPFNLLGDLKASVRKPSFGTTNLALADFKSMPGKNNVATFGTTPVSNWYSALLNNAGRVYINRTGTTQFRLAFTLDDNNDNGADLMKFFSGNAGAANRPQLVIQYYIP